MHKKNIWNSQDKMKKHIMQKLTKFNGGDLELAEEDTDDEIQKVKEFAGPNILIDTDERVDMFANFTNWKRRQMIPFL